MFPISAFLVCWVLNGVLTIGAQPMPSLLHVLSCLRQVVHVEELRTRVLYRSNSMFSRVAVWGSEHTLDMKRRLWVLGFILLGHAYNRATFRSTQDINTFCTCEGVARGEWAMGEDTHGMWVALLCRLVVQVSGPEWNESRTPVEALSPSCWPGGKKAPPPHIWCTGPTSQWLDPLNPWAWLNTFL